MRSETTLAFQVELRETVRVRRRKDGQEGHSIRNGIHFRDRGRSFWPFSLFFLPRRETKMQNAIGTIAKNCYCRRKSLTLTCIQWPLSVVIQVKCGKSNVKCEIDIPLQRSLVQWLLGRIKFVNVRLCQQVWKSKKTFRTIESIIWLLSSRDYYLLVVIMTSSLARSPICFCLCQMHSSWTLVGLGSTLFRMGVVPSTQDRILKTDLDLLWTLNSLM